MREFDNFFENSFRFEYYQSGVATYRKHYQEKGCIAPTTTVLAQLFKGRSTAVINGKTYHKEPGIVTMLPPGTVSESDVWGDTIVFRWVQFNFLFDGETNLLSLYRFPYVFDMATSLKLGNKIAMLVKCAQIPDKMEAIVKRKKIGWGICEDIMPFAEERPEFDMILSGVPRLNGVFALIREKLRGGVSIAEMAKGANLSVSRFHVLFRETTGLPPHSYIMREKLKRGMELLKKTDKTLDEISLDTGFCDRYHFSRQFKRMFGISPGKYRHAEFFR